MAIKKTKAPVKKSAMRPEPSSKKPVSLTYPKPDEMRGKVNVEPPKIPRHIEPLDIAPSRGIKQTGKKKDLPYAATAVGGSLVLSGALACFFYYVINLDVVFSLMLAFPFFIGLSILFYNFLELSERTGTQ